jgi:NAD(P)-dependent dehydrogenase (short-subunit alcohol dehydrogenase family)
MAPSKSSTLEPNRFFISKFIPYHYAKHPNIYEDTSLSGRTGIVTGANSGIGYETSKKLLGLGLSRLVLGVRSLDKGEAAAESLRAIAPEAKIDVWALDMVSYKSIQAFVQRCAAELRNIDFAILNAGGGTHLFDIIEETGHESMMQTNFYGSVLLTVLMLPVLRGRSSTETPPRITYISSLGEALAQLPPKVTSPFLAQFDDLKAMAWAADNRYYVSKLLSVIFLSRLAEEISSEHVIINMIELCFVKGGNGAENLQGMMRYALKTAWFLFGRTLEDAARIYVDAAVVKQKESHGCLLSYGNIVA